jgi:hypothetical protein
MIKNEVTIGVHGDVGSDIFDRATWNEFGTHDKKGKVLIPERSFIRAGYDNEKNNIEEDVKKLIEKVIAREITTTVAMNLIGSTTAGRIQEFAVDLRDPPNAPLTVALKGSSNPLVDTGQMIGAIDYKVKG